MDQRKIELLNGIIEEYIGKAIPVGSKFLSEKADWDLSPATIRNEMAELENDGYIYQPYTSAGRAPTEKGYAFYLKNNLSKFNLNSKEKIALDKVISETLKKYKNDPSVLIKELAKRFADLVNQTILVGFSPDEYYYTGLSNIFAQPEFNEQEKIVNLSGIIDHLDTEMGKIFHQIKKTEILIGEDNPFGVDCSLIITNINNPGKRIFGILGPIRMNYRKNINYLNYLKENINI
jgi:transcriptional regulator of heat shock response